MRRLKTLGGEALIVSEKLGETLFDRFDYAYREEGVGDASIARKVRKLGERYFGLARALDAALDSDDEEVANVLTRNGLGEGNTTALVKLARETDNHLQALSEQKVFSASLTWPTV